MKYFAVVDSSTNIVRTVHSIGDSATFTAPTGTIAVQVDQTLFQAIIRRNGKTSQVVYDPPSGLVSVVDQDPSVITQGAWNALRAKRNQLLIDTDKTQLPDFPNGSLYTDYRQALRDLPQNTTDPTQVVWPVLDTNAQGYLSGRVTAVAVRASMQSVKTAAAS